MKIDFESSSWLNIRYAIYSQGFDKIGGDIKIKCSQVVIN